MNIEYSETTIADMLPPKLENCDVRIHVTAAVKYPCTAH